MKLYLIDGWFSKSLNLISGPCLYIYECEGVYIWQLHFYTLINKERGY